MRKVEIPTSQASISTAIYNMGQMSLREALRESFRSFPAIQALHLLTWKRSPSTSFLNTSKPRLHSWLAQAQHTTKASPQTVWPPTLCLYLCNLLYSDGDFLTPTNPAILLLQLQWFLSINNTLLMKTCPEVFKKRVDSHFKPLKSVLKGVHCREGAAMLQHFNITAQSTWQTSAAQRSENSRKCWFSPNNFFSVHTTHDNPKWFKWMSDLQIFLTKGLVT